MRWKHFKSKSNSFKRRSFEDLATQRSSPMSMPSVGPTWNSHCDGITWKQSDSEKNSFVSFCASSSHFVIICFSFSFCVSLSRLVSIWFSVSQFVILSQFILNLFQFISNLSICARDSDARIEAGLVVSFHDVSSVHLHCILDLKENSFSCLFLLMKKHICGFMPSTAEKPWKLTFPAPTAQ